MAIPHGIRFRVLVGSVLVLLALFGVSSFVTISFYGDRMTRQVLGSATRISDIVRQATRYGMLLNRREDVRQIIATIGTEPGVERIRIYNKRGETMFSTVKPDEHAAVGLRAEPCSGCHGAAPPLASLPAGLATQVYEADSGSRFLAVITPIRNEPACSEAACHVHPPEKTVLGVLDVRLSLAETDAAIAEAEGSMVVFAIGMLLTVVPFTIWYFSATVTRPVRRLMRGARAVADGDLDQEISIRSSDELGRLADAFNSMTAALRREKEQNQRWADTLQEKVNEKTDELTAIHRRIVHVEKMASLGKLAATVAHELNNPLEAVLTCARLAGRRLRGGAGTEASRATTIDEVDLIAREATRCGTIVRNLLLFSRKQAGEVAIVPVQRIIGNAGEIVRHHCEISSVTFRSGVVPPELSLMCDEGQIQQALVALFVNAVEAMPEGGSLTVTAAPEAGSDDLAIEVTDTGTGIAPADVGRIFEPFFTTKEDGTGVGLGLSVVYGIVERHGGRITVASRQGIGTSFRIVLPRVAAPERTIRSETPENGVKA